MTNHRSTTWFDTPTRFIEAAGVRFAYRRLGAPDGIPVVLLNHWGANLDNFDPAIVDGLAAAWPVYALDYRGVGASSGEAPLTVAAMATDVAAILRALGLTQVDLIGFSLGGFVTQQIVLTEPGLIRRLVLAGTGPAGGEGIDKVGPVSWLLIAKGLLTFKDPKTYLFFTSTANGRRAAKAFLTRLRARKVDRDKAVTRKVFLRQLKAIKAWSLVPSENSADLARRIPGADLVLYPGAGHGGIFQYQDQFLTRATAFLAA